LKDTNFDFDRCKVRNAGNIIYIDAYFIPNDEVCPICGSTSLYKNGHTVKTIKHCTYHTSLILVKCHLQNYKCKECDSIFREENTFANPNETISKESIIIILEKLKQANITFESVACDMHLSRQNVIDVFDRYVDFTPGNLPKVMCWDEKHINKSMTDNAYIFVMLDFINIEIYDIVHSRHKYKLDKYFSLFTIEEKQKVEYISIDMWQPYYDLAKKHFKNAKIAVDSFHVMEMINNAMDRIRLNIMAKYNLKTLDLENNHPYYYILKKYKYFLTKELDNIPSEKFYNYKLGIWFDKHSLIKYMTDIDESLKLAYSLTTMYREFNKCANESNCRDELENIIDSFFDSKLTPFIEVAKTLSTWKECIINSFTLIPDALDKYGYPRRLSNGPIEGINSIIEKINVNGNGYTNFWRFRNRCIYVVNKTSYILNTPKKVK